MYLGTYGVIPAFSTRLASDKPLPESQGASQTLPRRFPGLPTRANTQPPGSSPPFRLSSSPSPAVVRPHLHLDTQVLLLSSLVRPVQLSLLSSDGRRKYRELFLSDSLSYASGASGAASAAPVSVSIPRPSSVFRLRCLYSHSRRLGSSSRPSIVRCVAPCASPLDCASPSPRWFEVLSAYCCCCRRLQVPCDGHGSLASKAAASQMLLSRRSQLEAPPPPTTASNHLLLGAAIDDRTWSCLHPVRKT